LSDRPALIVGSGGQDGRLLAEQLTRRDQPWIGLDLGRATSHRADTPEPIDITDAAACDDLIAQTRPAAIYYLAAYHASSENVDDSALDDLYRKSMAVNVTGWLNCLLAVSRVCPDTRLLYASSSLVIGEPRDHGQPHTEQTPWQPIGVYGYTKALGGLAAKQYRDDRNLHASVVHLFNHESSHRPTGFLSRKVVDAAARMAAGSDETLTLGNLDARVDWGYAPDYTRAMQLVIEQTRGDDYIIATGEAHRVGDWVDIAFDEAGVNPAGRVTTDQAILGRPSAGRIGDASKLRQATGWAPSITFEQMVRQMTRDAIRRLANAD